jgi:S-adenosylmethionine:tRNA ribosyltransferase-isomerase
MMHFSDLARYRYDLPAELVRTKGLEPRDSARLFVYDTKTDIVSMGTFANLAKYLPVQSLVVLNDTRVLPARLWLTKETGGKIEVFVLANQIEDEERIPVLVDRKVTLGQKLYFPNGEYCEVVDQAENIFSVKLHSEGGLLALLDQFGETPLPHYLEGAGTPETELRERYQTVFAESGASVAAPTASLHFTERVIESLQQKNIETARLTLNVGLGTFAPLRPENFETKRLHCEYAHIPVETAEAINTAHERGEKVVAVGTTVTRTLESAMEGGQVRPMSGPTDIFIFPPYHFQAVDALMTNFHLPETSLMLLVDAFLGHKGAKRDIMDLYNLAIQERYAFYSFGDSMLIL